MKKSPPTDVGVRYLFLHILAETRYFAAGCIPPFSHEGGRISRGRCRRKKLLFHQTNHVFDSRVPFNLKIRVKFPCPDQKPGKLCLSSRQSKGRLAEHFCPE